MKTKAKAKVAALTPASVPVTAPTRTYSVYVVLPGGSISSPRLTTQSEVRSWLASAPDMLHAIVASFDDGRLVASDRVEGRPVTYRNRTGPTRIRPEAS